MGWDIRRTHCPPLLLYNYFFTVYPSGILELGIPGTAGYSMWFTDGGFIKSYLPANGAPGPLNADLLDPSTTSSGSFGGEVMALQLNVDFSDSGLLSGAFGIPFGDLVLYNFTDLPELNGMRIRQYLNHVNILLGGGTNLYTISELLSLTASINSSFYNGVPSQFAREHLRIGWKDGDMTSYGQGSWGSDPTKGNAAGLMTAHYNEVYASSSGRVEIGFPGTSGYSMIFTSANVILAYLPASGSAGPLTSDLGDPTSSASGQFGGDVLALRLDIDFSDAGLLASNSGLKFGDLVLSNFNDLPDLNGLTVRQFMDIVNTALGGGSSPYPISDLDPVTDNISLAFTPGSRTPFAQEHLFSTYCPPNQCPTASNFTLVTTEGAAIKFKLKGSDQDNNSLTYSISRYPSHGIVSTSSSGGATYTPFAGYLGSDQFEYKVSDGTCEAYAIVSLSVSKFKAYKGDLALNAQEGVNAIGDSTYTTITGTLTIQGAANISDLKPLSTLTSIGGWLTIDSNDSLTTLNGLNNIVSLGGLLTVSHNPALTSIDPLDKITAVRGISISFDSSLANINGLSNITTVNGGNLYIQYNKLLTSIDPLSNITSVGGGLYVRSNDKLKDIKGLSSIDSVGGSLYIQYNPSLTNLEGLNNLVSVHGNLYVQNNVALTEFCSLFTLINGNGLGGFYYVNGNAVNPKVSDINSAGPCAPTTNVNAETSAIPTAYKLEQNYPNPFNPTTSIKYSIPTGGFVSLKIYDVLGREVATLVNETKAPGFYKANFNASNLASGLYIYRLTSGTHSYAKKMLLIK